MKVDDALLLHTFYDQVLNKQEKGVGVDIDLAWDMQEDMDQLATFVDRYLKAREKLTKEMGEPMKDDPNRYTLKDVQAFLAEIEKLLEKDIEVTVKKYPESVFRAGLRGVRVGGTLKKAKEFLVIAPKEKELVENGQNSKKQKS